MGAHNRTNAPHGMRCAGARYSSAMCSWTTPQIFYELLPTIGMVVIVLLAGRMKA